MEHDRNAKIEIGGQAFELILTTRATKEIAGRYGGLENLGQIHSAVIQLENAVSGEKEGTLEQGARELTFSLKSISDQDALLETSADAKEMQTLFQKIAETQNEMLTAGQVMETVSEGMEESSETIAAAAKLCDMTAEDVDGWGENLSESQRQYSGVTSDAVSEGNDKIARVNRRLADGHMAFQSAAEKLLDISAASSAATPNPLAICMNTP